MITNRDFDIIVIGAGHAGVEAGLACARLGNKTLLLTLTLDSVSFMACNPNIGGTAKGHLVREIDALGGQMAITADSALLQLRMLNLSKGASVHSLRGQADKITYHHEMKQTVERQSGLTLLQSEAIELLCENSKIIGLKTALGDFYYASAIVLASGVYLDSEIIIGGYRKKEGPSGFSRAEGLTQSLISLGHSIRRFKTGTPARVHSDSIDYSKMTPQFGDSDIYAFSFMTDTVKDANLPCYLTYTSPATHQIIRDNIHLSPLYNGSIKSVGPRYCPSIEDKVMRFAEKERHQIFIEPESSLTCEMYVQGMSSSLPQEVQLAMYRSVIGLENVKILRYAYAIEYDCIDSAELFPSLMSKKISGLFFAGQINGSSGYEEAAAQGLIAGINAHRYIHSCAPLVIGRNQGYIGVLIDDLVTKGTNEPYRMMTARAEYRLHLRQENADFRLTQVGRDIGLVDNLRYTRYLDKVALFSQYSTLCSKSVSPKLFAPLFEQIGEALPCGGMTYADMLRRSTIEPEDLVRFFDDFKALDLRVLREVATTIKYEGYLTKQTASICELQKLENKILPPTIDYSKLSGLRLEARAKLNQIRPLTLGQASRISGVSPADITVLMVSLYKSKSHSDPKE